MPNGNPHRDTAEQAALYAAGALTPEERAAFEEQLHNKDAAATDELKSLSPAIELLAEAVPPITAPKGVRDALIARIAKDAQRTHEVAPNEPFYFQRNDSAEWTDSGIAGLRIRALFVDRERGVKTLLIRMEAGCEVPSHPHPGAEECYIIEGDIHTAGTVLGPGDYMRAPAGSIHGRSFTRGGCTMLVTAGLDEHEFN